MKKCKKCLQDKDYSEFHKSKGHRDGLYPYCKSIPHTRGDEPCQETVTIFLPWYSPHTWG